MYILYSSVSIILIIGHGTRLLWMLGVASLLMPPPPPVTKQVRPPSLPGLQSSWSCRCPVTSRSRPYLNRRMHDGFNDIRDVFNAETSTCFFYHLLLYILCYTSYRRYFYTDTENEPTYIYIIYIYIFQDYMLQIVTPTVYEIYRGASGAC